MSESKRILMICSQYPPVYGGAGAQAALLARYMADAGARCSVVTLDQEGLGNRVESGVSVVRVGRGIQPRTRGHRLWTTILLGLRSAWEVIRRRPDVIHIHGAYWWSIPPAVIGRLLGRVVVVKSTRDGEDDARTVFAKRVRGLSVGRFYGLSLRAATWFIVLNQDSLRKAEEAGIGAKTLLMKNGVDTPAMRRTDDRRRRARERYGIPPDRKVVTFVGYLVEHKGVSELLTAWDELAPSDAELWLVGPSTGFYRELQTDYPTQIATLVDRGRRVRAFGHVENSKLPEIYWATDIFTLPSFAEGMPNSLMEAIVAGCQIVATRIPGIVDLVDEDSAFLCEAGDARSVRAALSAALSDAPKGTTSVANGIAMENISRQYADIYSRPRVE